MVVFFFAAEAGGVVTAPVAIVWVVAVGVPVLVAAVVLTVAWVVAAPVLVAAPVAAVVVAVWVTEIGRAHV